MIKLINPSLMSRFTHILSSDPALDKDAEGFKEAYERFLETGAKPPIKNGEEPTVFHLEPLKDAELDAATRGQLANGGSAWAVETACYALKQIDNLRDHDGKPFVLEFEMVNGFEKVCKEHRNLMGREVLAELGTVVIGKQSPS
jgi:hypothetical protein